MYFQFAVSRGVRLSGEQFRHIAQMRNSFVSSCSQCWCEIHSLETTATLFARNYDDRTITKMNSPESRTPFCLH